MHLAAMLRLDPLGNLAVLSRPSSLIKGLNKDSRGGVEMERIEGGRR